jgi:hypothetical protein
VIFRRQPTPFAYLDVGSTPRRFRHDLPSNIGVFGSIRPDLRLPVPLSGLLKLPENARDRTVARASSWQWCQLFFWRVAFRLHSDYHSHIIPLSAAITLLPLGSASR